MKTKTTKQQTTKSIKDLFVSRADTFDKRTSKILKAMTGALEAIHEFMNVSVVEKQGGKLAWEDVSLVIDTTKDAFVVLVGVIKYPPGTELELDSGQKVKVTKQTEPYFRRLVRAGIPLKVAGKTKKQVLNYLKKMEAKETKQQEVSFLDKLAQQEVEFDLSKLTEEQRKAYEASKIISTSKAS